MKKFTLKELAEKYSVTKKLVEGWVARGKFPNAYKADSEIGISYWLIPESDLENFEVPEGRGKPRSANPSKSTLAKRKSREKE